MGGDVGWEPAGSEDKQSSSPVGRWCDPPWPSSVLLWSAPLGHRGDPQWPWCLYVHVTGHPLSGPDQGSTPCHHQCHPLTRSRPPPPTLLSLLLCLGAKKCHISSERHRVTWLVQPPLHNSTLPILPSPAAEPPAGALPRLTSAPPAMEMMHFPQSNFYYLLIFLDLFELAPFLFGVTRNHPV